MEYTEKVSEYQLAYGKGRRTLPKARLWNAEQVAKVCLDLTEEPQEIVRILCTDVNLELLAWSDLFKGSITNCEVSISEVLRFALLVPNCLRVFLVHQHPSGSAKLSDDDKALADRLGEAFKAVGLQFMDLVAVTPNEFSAKSTFGKPLTIHK